MRCHSFTAAALAAGVAFALGACAPSEGGTSLSFRRNWQVSIGQKVPTYGATALTGSIDSLSELRGKVVLLNTWATWCAPCRKELPDLQSIFTRYSEQGLVVVGVSIDTGNEPSEIIDFAKGFGVTYPLWHDPDDKVSRVFLANGVPATYLIGRDGTLRWKHLGQISGDDPALNSELSKALEEE